jgi:dynein heavy chain, axonemal
MPAVEKYGAQPPIELLRQIITMRGFYTRPPFNFTWKNLQNFTMIASAAPPSGGRFPLSPRFMRQFHIFTVPEADEEIIRAIFEGIICGFLKAFNFNDAI